MSTPVPPSMGIPQPVPPESPRFMPSNSTNATALGGAIATVVIGILGAKHIFLPAGIESAVAVIAATIAGYIPNSGRK